MREQLTDRDVLLPILSELGEVTDYSIIGADLTLFYQLHDRSRGTDDLGQRSDIEDGVEGHALPSRFKSAIPESFSVNDLSVMPDENDRPGNLTGVDGL